jgi:hypothetical protein
MKRLLTIAIVLGLTHSAWALGTTKNPANANHAAAHAKGATGNNIRVGIIEVGSNANPASITGALTKNLNFVGSSTGLGADPGAAINTASSNHASLVSEIIAAPHATNTGVATGSRRYVGYATSTSEIFSAVDWYTRQYNVGIFNHSWGGSAVGSTNAQAMANGTFNFTANTALSITGNNFQFNNPLGHAIHRVSVTLTLNDGDSAADAGNLWLQFHNSGTVLNFAAATGFANNANSTSTINTELTPAQTTQLTNMLAAAPANQVQVRLFRSAGGDIDGQPGNGNVIGLSNANNASLTLWSRNNGGASAQALAFDWHSVTKDVLHVKSAGNNGSTSTQITRPGDFFNGLTVGALNGNSRRASSSYRLTGENNTVADARKPDLVAPGSNVTGQNTNASSGTSFAAPHVAGGAALVSQRGGLALGDANGLDHLGVKAILMNSTRKRKIAGENAANFNITDNAGTSGEFADKDYLNAAQDGIRQGAASLTGAWTPSAWTFTTGGGAGGGRGLFSTSAPLDDELGTGAFDAERAIVQTDGGQQNPGEVTPIGWDIDTTLTSNTYDFEKQLHGGDFITATLVWDRIVTETNGVGGTVNELDVNDTHAAQALNDFILEIFLREDLGGGIKSAPIVIAESVSAMDNVQHLHFPVPEDGHYGLRVSVFNATALTGYGLAWWTVPEPTGVVMILMGVAVISVRRRAAA